MRNTWRPKPADRVVRHPRQDEIQPIRLRIPTRRITRRLTASPLTLILFFAALILLGTLLLLMPFTHHGGGFTPFMTALFTSASAITLTGLEVEGTAAYWTRAGHVIILGMIYIGGLAFMILSTFLLVLVGQRIALAQRLRMPESLLINQIGGMLRLTIGVISVATGIQVAGFLALLARFYFLYSPAEAVWQAAFHSVSAFNGSGFTVFSESGGMMAFQSDGVVLFIFAALIFLGAISYLVIIDLFQIRRFSRFALNTKLVLVTTAALILIGFVGVFSLEYQNPATLGPLTLQDKLSVSVFQSISGRTAGFDVVDFEGTRQHANILTAGLMFVGGASGSVAGGIKVNTVAVVLVAVFSIIRGRNNASAFGREVPLPQVQRAMVIGAFSTAFVFFVVLVLSIVEEDLGFQNVFFESVSAFGNVGLSTGFTGGLSSLGQLVVVMTMFIGRLGPLTAGLLMAQRLQLDMYRYPRERVTIG